MLTVPHQGVRQVSVIWDLPEEAPRATFVLAHGSGAPMSSAFLEEIAPSIARAAGPGGHAVQLCLRRADGAHGRRAGLRSDGPRWRPFTRRPWTPRELASPISR